MKKLGIALISLIVLLFIGYQLYVSSKLPVRSGELKLTGLQQPVTTIYDKWGIPHIQAESELDVMRTLGFVHAQDRLFQMDLLRRVGKGELAALLGESVINVDKLFRTLGTREFSFANAKRIEQQGGEFKALLDAYYDGINQAIDTLPVPVEYDLLGAKPEHFSIVDGMGIFAYIAHSFTSGLKHDPIVTALAQKLPTEKFSQLELSWPEGDSYNSAKASKLSEETLLALADNSTGIIEQLPYGIVIGSNAWAVSPSRTKNGKAMLANDPHIAFASPSVWYEAQVDSPAGEVYGHYLTGIPFPLLVRKPQLAQGLTMLTSDDADLIRLEYNKDKSQVLIADTWQPVTKRKETIQVKDAQAITFDVEITTLGPLVNEVLNLSDQDPVALYWVYTMEENKPFDTIFGMYRAETMEEMQEAMGKHWAPGLNMVYADAKGNIAQWGFGRYIKRPAGNNGKVIVDGTKAENVPTGVYPFAHNPRIINPESGYVFSTNHAFPNSKPNSEHLGYYLPVHRAMWADEKLSQGNDWNVEQYKALQTENANKRPYLLHDKLEKLAKRSDLSGQAKSALERVLDWDKQYLPDSQGAAIFERFYYFLLDKTYKDEMGSELFKRFVNNSIMDNSFYMLNKNSASTWWDNVETGAVESEQDIYKAALEATVNSLAEQLGDMDNWRWKNTASLTHNHPLGKVKPLDKLFNVGPFTVSGSLRALNNMQYKYSDEQIVVTNGPSTRRIIDFADSRNAITALPTGQSGNVFDKHYQDQVEVYHSNQYRDAIMLEKGNKLDGSSTLIFKPN